MTPTRTEKIFPARPASLPSLVAFLAEHAAAAGVPRDKELRLHVAVEEALINVCNHAYQGQPGEVRVGFRETPRTCEVELEYGGPAFDPLAQPRPDVHRSLDQRQPGGLGLLLIREFVDDARYARVGERNLLTLIVEK